MKTNQTKPNRSSAFGVLLSLLLLLALPALVQAQYNYTTNNGTISITQYTGSGGAVTIPDTINGLPVTSIGDSAFSGCSSLSNLTIGNSVISIGQGAFWGCSNLASATIPNSVTSIGDGTFQYCTSLTGAYFKGNAPSIASGVFNGADAATVYYLPGATGWGLTFGGRPTALWVLPYPVILNTGPGFGVQTNGFAFIISWATNLPVVVEACTNLTNPTWSPVRTNTLTGGWSYFSDPQWTNHPARFYRLTLPAPGKKWLTVAAVTMTSQTNTAANLQTFFSYMERAASNGVDLIVFPEVALQGCPGWREDSSPPSVQEMAYTRQTAETIPGQSTSNVVAKAKELNLFVVFGMTEKDGAGLLYNANVFLGPDGVIGKHRKSYFIGNDSQIWRLGSEYAVLDSPIGKIGLIICIELYSGGNYPGPLLASQGADLLVTCSAWWSSGSGSWATATVLNAVQANRWHVASQQVGPVGHVQVYGHSQIVDPKGKIVCDTGAMEGLVIWATDILIDTRTP